MLGGRRSFAEGGWGGTPVGDVLPVVLERAERQILRPSCSRLPPDARRRDVPGHADRRRRGRVDAAVERDAAGLEREPPCAASKPGATVLLSARRRPKQEQIVLAYQRYGRGKALALPVQDTWHVAAWTPKTAGHRHHARDVLAPAGPLARRTACPSRSTSRRRVGSRRTGRAGEAVGGGARRGVRRGQRQPRRRHGSPRRPARRPKCRSTGRSTKDGEYRTTFTPDEPGIYDVQGDGGARFKGSRHGATCTSASRPATLSISTRRMRAPLLKRIAEDTGGRFFTPANAASLPEAISYSGRGVTGRRGARAVGHAGAVPAAAHGD